MRRVLSTLSILGLIFATTACEDNPSGPVERLFEGQARALAGGTVTPWVLRDPDGTPLAFGIRFDEGVLQGLPAGMDGVVLPFPDEAPVPPFDHMTFDWMPMGHSPMGIYDVPHFDVHAYRIDQAARDRITPADPDFGAMAACEPPAARIPTGYVPSSGAVPRMGSHWIDPTSPEFAGQPFGASLHYGFWNCEMVFLEPMIAKSFLDAGGSAGGPIAQPAVYPEPGWYPTTWSLERVEGVWTLTLGDLLER